MGFFNRSMPEWKPNDIPDLSFNGPTDFVDIGFLGGDDHRSAFAQIFRKMLADNQGALLGLDLVTIDAKRPVVSNLQVPVKLRDIDATRLAGELYDSQNDTV